MPVFLIQPFRPQTPRGVAVSYALRAISPWVTLAALAALAAIAYRAWRNARWWGRALLVLAMLVTAGAPTGRQLEKVEVISDYWFDWRTYLAQ